MKKRLLIGGSLLIIAATAAYGQEGTQPDSSTYSSSSTYSHTSTTSSWGWWRGGGPLYRAHEASLDLFGTLALDQHIIDHISGDKVRQNARLGAGLGLNIFFTRYIGVGGEGYTENTAHNFVDDADAFLILRFPIWNTGLAPYIFGGGGHKFDPLNEGYSEGGGGIEYRFTPQVGVFVDARGVFTSRTGNYALGRAGLRLVF